MTARWTFVGPRPVEVWRPVPGFAGYFVSDEGRVASEMRRERRLLALVIKSHGYLSVNLIRDGRRVTRTVHSLVAEAFLGARPDGLIVRHLDGDQHNNRVGNLRWGTHSENEADKVRHGTHPNARKTHCKSGHAFDAENTRISPQGHRVCRACVRESNAARRAA